MISKKLMHTVLNRLQVIIGLSDMIEITEDPKKRSELHAALRDHIRLLTELLERQVKKT